MKQGIYTVTENTNTAPNVFRMTLKGDTAAISASGQFINIKLDGLFLRRPISVYDYTQESITIIYKVVGEGTEAMSKLACGASLDVLVGLGNGYDTSKSGERPLLVGGGIGVPPLWLLCRRLIEKGAKPTVILGAGSAPEVFYRDEFEKVGATVYVTTADGSMGTKGFVTDVMKTLAYTYFYACGPLPMYRAMEETAVTDGEYSFEQRMGCGFGACMGCTMMTKSGAKRVCKEGPVFQRGEIIW